MKLLHDGGQRVLDSESSSALLGPLFVSLLGQAVEEWAERASRQKLLGCSSGLLGMVDKVCCG